MSGIDYTKIERPVEPAFANEDPEGWCEVLAWEEARADKLEQENEELRRVVSDLVTVFDSEEISGLQCQNIYHAKQALIDNQLQKG